VAASLNGEVECVKILLEHQANVNTLTENQNSPLMKAELNCHDTVRPPPLYFPLSLSPPPRLLLPIVSLYFDMGWLPLVGSL